MRVANQGQWWVIEPQRALSNNSVCYKEKYHTLLLDGARTVKRIVDDECYKKEEVLRWKWHKQF